ncbi:hypothetical protein [Bauldia litoralis]|uniref:hypothetical protein n=1 Tax=Bauldia litoralis TaxID=665467 RepID=UPI003266ACAB
MCQVHQVDFEEIVADVIFVDLPVRYLDHGDAGDSRQLGALFGRQAEIGDDNGIEVLICIPVQGIDQEQERAVKAAVAGRQDMTVAGTGVPPTTQKPVLRHLWQQK